MPPVADRPGARPAALVLEDGRSFAGWALGADVLGRGEVVFNTAMTGYQEVLTDPSYAGQMLCMTYPLQGNYGTRPADAESDRVWARGFIARWVCPSPSHHSSSASLDEYLRAQGVPGIGGVDTRALTRHLRTLGTQRAVLSHEDRPPSAARLAELADLARRVTSLSDQDLVAEVSRRAPVEWRDALPDELRGRSHARGAGLTIAVADYGVKSNILRSLRQRGCRVIVLPHGAAWDDVLGVEADGLLLPNGPGDPARLEGPVELCRQALGRLPLMGICLGHQVLGMAAGASTSRLRFGHHGANHPVRDLLNGRVHITSQNHEFQVDGPSLPDGDFAISEINLNDGSVEGLAHRSLPAFSVQYHPEACPGPTDSQHVFDRFVEMVRERRPLLRAVGGAAPHERPRRVLIVGSGPIVIGQAAEFDYAGTQACRALREEGVETVLVNSNPATIMTDEEVADRVYIEPLTIEVLERIIERERPDAILPTLGGQTGLNLAMELHREGVLMRHEVRFLGADADVIRRAEDREAFKQLLLDIGEPVPPSRVCTSVAEARAVAAEIGLPLVVRPAYTLGGTGGGFATTPEELDRVVRGGLAASPIGQVLVERSLWGWKEIEYEVMRDASGTCITVCNMENLDPMGVHTGDSIVVAPAQTLSDRDHQMLRSSALRIIRALGIEGGCNVQFALDPASSAYHVIEVNPRVSRSSALASKATGYPIARVAAKVAVGRRLDEIRNQVTGRTFAAFEPALDYVVVKVPRWPFDKFPGADRRLGTQMKSTGEVMAIARTFEAALHKAVRSLEHPRPADDELDDPDLIEVPNDRRLFALMRALRGGASPSDLARRSGIDAWFLQRIADMLAWEEPEGPPAYKRVDTCAAEFDAETHYYYSSPGDEESEASPSAAPAALVLGSGPIRIGQGIEFDYCSVHAASALRRAGTLAVIANSNPETVSTDFDASDRLYFEPLDARSAESVARAEGILGAVVQFGGQTAVNLAAPLDSRGVPVLGSSVDAIDLAEDRRRLTAALDAIGVPYPAGEATTSTDEALAIAERIGYPVLVRPSYVLGGRAMEIVSGPDELCRYLDWARRTLPRGSLLVDRYLAGVEVEVDAVSDGETVVVPGVVRHVERAGVHSGDSLAVYPAHGLEPAETDEIVTSTVRIARHLGLRGLLNIQYVLHGGRLHVLEVNPRASRTVPMLSKVTGVAMVELATRVMLGERLADAGWASGLVPQRPLVAVKAPVFSMAKMVGVDPFGGPEMRSTGEVMGVDRTLRGALRKAFLAAGVVLSPGAPVLLAAAESDEPDLQPVARGLGVLGCPVVTPAAGAEILRRAGLPGRAVSDAGALDLVARGAVALVVSTSRHEGFDLRRAAVERGTPCLTSLDTALALVDCAPVPPPTLQVRTLTEWRETPD